MLSATQTLIFENQNWNTDYPGNCAIIFSVTNGVKGSIWIIWYQPHQYHDAAFPPRMAWNIIVKYHILIR